MYMGGIGPRMAKQNQDDQLELTYSSYVKTQDVTLKTCRFELVSPCTFPTTITITPLAYIDVSKVHELVYEFQRTGL